MNARIHILMSNLGALATLAVVVAGCATPFEAELTDRDRAIAPPSATAPSQGRTVLWGGRILARADVDGVTALAVEAYPMGINDKPLPVSQGEGWQFIVRQDSALVPEEYVPGHFLTALGDYIGQAQGAEASDLAGELPVVQGRRVEIWSPHAYPQPGESRVPGVTYTGVPERRNNARINFHYRYRPRR